MSKLEKMSLEKPSFLYHGSCVRGITQLKPKQEGLFATPSLAIALIFLLEKRDGYLIKKELTKFNDVLCVLIITDRDEVMQNDKGGSIYTLPSDSFSIKPNQPLGRYKYFSDKAVNPISEDFKPSAIDAMINNGTQVYFIDEKTYIKIKESNDKGYSIIKTLKSENQLRGINVKTFPPGNWEKLGFNPWGNR